MDDARLIVDPPADGAWNMAVDQAILETADRTGLVTLRFYQWSEPTLSLGYFQSHRDRDKHPASLDCAMLRRRTGGGAILHDKELTYSLCIPSSNRWSKQNSDLYNIVHQHIIDHLKTQQINAYLFGEKQLGENQLLEDSATSQSGTLEDQDQQPIIDQKAFMCFHRRSSGDICLNGFKIVGSAQRRLKNSLLQHGSILFKRSSFSKTLPGIEDLVSFTGDYGTLVAQLRNSIENSLQISLKMRCSPVMKMIPHCI